jgi:ABC-type lipoprotein release transport system permease subunit
MVAVVVLFAAIATAVSVGAARRAAGIDPARVLRDL